MYPAQSVYCCPDYIKTWFLGTLLWSSCSKHVSTQALCLSFELPGAALGTQSSYLVDFSYNPGNMNGKRSYFCFSLRCSSAWN